MCELICEETGGVMDIGSKQGYPAGALSNFQPRRFIFDDVECASREGLLQAFKHKNPEVQEHICSLTGFKAKKAGGRHWQRTQTLWWKGVAYKRKSKEYQELLDRAYDALATNEGFCRALLASGNAVLKHSHGARKKEPETCLTSREFCSRLTRIRSRLQEGAS